MLILMLVLTGCVFNLAQENAPAVDHYKKLKPGTKIYFHSIDDKLVVGPKLNSEGDVTIYQLGNDGIFKNHGENENTGGKSVKYTVTKTGVLVPKPGAKSIKYNYNENGDLVPDGCNQCVFRSDKPTYYVKGFKNILIPVEMLYSKNQLQGLFKDKVLFSKALEEKKKVEKELLVDAASNKTSEIAPAEEKNLAEGMVPDKTCNGEITLFILKSDGSLKRTPSDPYLPTGMRMSYKIMDNFLLKPLFEKNLNDFVMSYLIGKDGDLIPSRKNQHDIRTEPGRLLSFMLGERGFIFPVKEMMDSGNSVSYYFNGNLIHRSRQFSEVFSNSSTLLINNEKFELPDLRTGPSLACGINGLCERKPAHRVAKRHASFKNPALDKASHAPNPQQYRRYHVEHQPHYSHPRPKYQTVYHSPPVVVAPPQQPPVVMAPPPPPVVVSPPVQQVIIPPFSDPHSCEVPSLPVIQAPPCRTSFTAPVSYRTAPTQNYGVVPTQKVSSFAATRPASKNCKTCSPPIPIPENPVSCDKQTIIVQNCKCPVVQPCLADLPPPINCESCECKEPKVRTDIVVHDCRGKEIPIIPEITDNCDVVLYKLTCKGHLIRFPQCTEPEFGYDILFELLLDEFILVPTSRPKNQFTLSYALQENGNLVPEKWNKNTFKKPPGSLLYFMLGKNNILFPVQQRYEVDGSLSYFFQNQFLLRLTNPVDKPVYFTTLQSPIYAYVNNVTMITCSSKPRINPLRGSNWRKFRSSSESVECCSKNIFLTGPRRQNIKIAPYLNKKGIPVVYELDCNGIFYRSPKDKKRCVILRSYMLLKEQILIPSNETDGYIYAEAKNGDMYPYLFPGGKIAAPVGQSVKYLLCQKGILLPICVEIIGDYICYLFKDIVVFRERALCKRGFGDDDCECQELTPILCDEHCKNEPECELFKDEDGNHVYFEKDGKILRRHPEEDVPEIILGKEGSFKIEKDGSLTSVPPEPPHGDIINFKIEKYGDLLEDEKNERVAPSSYYVLAKNADLIAATVKRTKHCITLYSKCGKRFFKVCEDKKSCCRKKCESEEEKNHSKGKNHSKDEKHDSKEEDHHDSGEEHHKSEEKEKKQRKPKSKKIHRHRCSKERHGDWSGSGERHRDCSRNRDDHHHHHSEEDSHEKSCKHRTPSGRDPLRLFDDPPPKKCCDNEPQSIYIPIPLKNAVIEDPCKTCPDKLKSKCEKWKDALNLLAKDSGLPMNLELQLDTQCVKEIRDWAEKCDKVLNRRDLMTRFNECLKNLKAAGVAADDE